MVISQRKAKDEMQAQKCIGSNIQIVVRTSF